MYIQVLNCYLVLFYYSEAAAVKARWLGNFCPRQPVHRALKRQQQPRPLSAAPGSSALNRPGPAREFKSEARAHPASSGPARLLKTTCPSQGLRPSPASGNGPPVRIINPAPGRPAISTLPHRCDGFYGHQPAGPAREFKLQARVHRCHSGPGLPASSNDLSQGSTPRSRGRPAQSGSSAPHRVGLPSLLSAAPGSTVLNRPAPLGSLGCLLGFIGPTLGPARLLK